MKNFNLNQNKTLKKLTTLLVFAFLTAKINAQKSVAIEGWPTPPIETQKAPMWLGGDPVLGRLTCPPITRINLEEKVSEGLLLNEVKVRESKNQTVWEYKLKEGIYWWSGQEATSLDLLNFFNVNIKEIVAQKGGGLWSLPSYQSKIEGKSLIVTWSSKPQYGPYIINDISFTRPGKDPKSNFSYECTGIYSAKAKEGYLDLTPNKSYFKSRPKILFQTTEGPSLVTKADQTLSFQMAKEISTKTSKSVFRSKEKCENIVPLPLYTTAFWNYEKKWFKDSKVRSVLASTFVKKALLYAGGKGWGDSSSSIIPAGHPGHGSASKDDPLHLKVISERLDKLAPKIDARSKYRLDKNKAPLTLSISSPLGDTIVSKVFIDNLKSIGIKGILKPYEKNSRNYDVLITGLFVPWPSANLLPWYHSQVKNKTIPIQVSSSSLDKMLESYALSTTGKYPDFKTLRKIHAASIQQQDLTPIVRHKACLVSSSGLHKKTAVNGEEPDWFKKILF